jgi:hypothetical protein
MFQIPSKRKHRDPKTTGKYRSTANQSGKRHRRKATTEERRQMQATQPDVTLVLLPSGKRRFVRV